MDKKSSSRLFVHERLQMSVCCFTPKSAIFRFLERDCGMTWGNAYTA